MTLNLTLPSEIETLLKQSATQSGQTVDTYVSQLIESNMPMNESGAALVAALDVAPKVPPEWLTNWNA
jgi:hypothetical protein